MKGRGLKSLAAELLEILACLRCRGPLELREDLLRCGRCGSAFPQGDERFLDFLLSDPCPDGWSERQEQMEAWYEELCGQPQAAAGCFLNDYSPYAPVLRSLAGTILDVGGGIGIGRHFIQSNCRYIVVEPSSYWLSADWSDLIPRFPCLDRPPLCIRAAGENIPLSDRSADAALALWSLNHTRYPGVVVQEIHRIVKPGGTFLLVLEDMEPSWADIRTGAFPPRIPGLNHRSWARKTLSTAGLRRWPVQDDHVRIRERELEDWLRGCFQIQARWWVRGYLSFQLQRQ